MIRFTDSEIDAFLDGILHASGSALKYYTLPANLQSMRAAMRRAIGEAQNKCALPPPPPPRLSPREEWLRSLKVGDQVARWSLNIFPWDIFPWDEPIKEFDGVSCVIEIRPMDLRLEHGNWSYRRIDGRVHAPVGYGWISPVQGTEANHNG